MEKKNKYNQEVNSFQNKGHSRWVICFVKCGKGEDGWESYLYYCVGGVWEEFVRVHRFQKFVLALT